MELAWSESGLVPCAVQHALSGEFLMLGYMNAQSLELTLRSDRVVFFSRSRGRLWKKGETSGNELHLKSLWLDCDSDTLLALVEPQGPTCHRGTPTCFDPLASSEEPHSMPPRPLGTELFDLEHVLSKRLAELSTNGAEALSDEGPTSYTTKLLNAGTDRILRKLSEEYSELLCAAKNNQLRPSADAKTDLVSESADVLYHLMVLWQNQSVTLVEVLLELQTRRGKRRPQDGLVPKL
jgi:phosphoribosyl-AMP cyclohydrolase / phosphoribosyl-ATP pyrophosphohydrolase